MAIMTFAQATDMTVVDEMKRNPKIICFGYGDGGGRFGISGITGEAVAKEFGFMTRVFDTGICETQEAGAGIGAALMGVRPIVNMQMSNFAIDAWGQIVSQAANIRFKLANKLECPVVYRMKFAATGGMSVHHSGCFHNWLANQPGLFVVIPSTPADARGLWRTALRTPKDPVVMMEQTPLGSMKGTVPDDDYTIPFGKADIKREGKDITIVAIGLWVSKALEAAEDLAKQGIQAEVWDPRTLTPLDRASLIASVKKTGAMVVVDQAPKNFGSTGEFSMTIAEALTPVPPMARVATMDTPVGFSPTLEDYILPNKDKIISAAKSVLERKRQVMGSK